MFSLVGLGGVGEDADSWVELDREPKGGDNSWVELDEEPEGGSKSSVGRRGRKDLGMNDSAFRRLSPCS